jgi:hypothetical protein
MCENERCVSMSLGDEKCKLDGGVDVEVGDLGIGGFETLFLRGVSYEQ